MAKFGSDQVAFLLVDGFSILGAITQFSDTKEAMLEEVTPLGAGWQEQAATGLKRAEFSQEGFFDDVTDGINDALSGKQGVSRILSYGIEGNTIGKKFVGFAGAMQANYSRVASRGELHKANATYQGNGQVDEGVILHEHAEETAASGDTQASSVDNSASSGDGGAGYLQVSALTLGGYDSATVKIQHSDDNVAFVDLVTFDNVSTAPEAQRKEVAGTVNRYLAASWAFNGTGSNQSITFMAGFSRF